MTEPPADVVTFPAEVRPYDGQAWAGLDDARRLWPDAALIDDATLTGLLSAANGTCRQYAPLVDWPNLDPERREQLTEAVVWHARDTWTARVQDPAGDVLGTGVYVPRPLSGQVRILLRPPRGPSIG